MEDKLFFPQTYLIVLRVTRNDGSQENYDIYSLPEYQQLKDAYLEVLDLSLRLIYHFCIPLASN
jgi:hypothetical protein